MTNPIPPSMSPAPDLPRGESRLGDRSLFPDLTARVYLNWSGISAPSAPVVRAMTTLLGDYARRGFSAYPTWRDQRARLRAMIGALIGATADDIAFVQSTTRGLSDIALCIPWRPKDRIVLFTGEFPANVTPWQCAASLFNLDVTFLPLAGFDGDASLGLSQLRAELERGARLVAVSAVQFQTGLRMPLKEMAALCHSYGAEICVDAVQACGAVPIDVGAWHIDYLACGAHKWLMNVEGVGFVYIRPERVSALRPASAGWLSHEDGLGFLFRGPGHLRYDRPIKKRADFLEGGNINAAGCAGLHASLDLILQIGVPAIHEHANRLLDALEGGLTARGFSSRRSQSPERRSCILSLDPPEGASVVALHQALTARGIACSIPDGALRFAPHWPNHADDVPVVLAAIDECLPLASRAAGA